MNDAPRLQAGYAAANLGRLLDGVLARYADLLTVPEQDWIDVFRALPVEPATVWARLCSRKGGVHRLDRLAWADVEHVPDAVDALVGAGLAEVDGPWDRAELVGLLTRAELAQVLAAEGALPADTRRPALEAAAEGLPVEVLREATRRRFRSVALEGTGILAVLQVLYFGNLHQDLREWVLSDLGLTRYPTYPVGREERLFASRDELERVLADAAWAARLEGLDRDGLEAALDTLGPRPEHPLLGRTRDHALEAVGRELERAERWEAALRAWRLCGRPPGRERAVRVLTHQRRFEAALAETGAILADPLDEEERAFALAFRPRLQRRVGLRPTVAPTYRPTVRTIAVPSSDLPVEQAALAWHRERGWRGFHGENALWTTLFGLVFWDELLLPVRGAFHHPFQRGPMDLFTPGFARDRRAALAARLDRFRADPDPAADLRARWEAHHGTAMRLVAWDAVSLDDLVLAVETLPRAGVAAVLERMASDLRHGRRGLPDLLLVDPEGRARLSEVKSPGDRLQAHQGRWLAFFEAQRIPCEELRVVPEPPGRPA